MERTDKMDGKGGWRVLGGEGGGEKEKGDALRERLLGENWQELFERAVGFAKEQTNWRHWRGGTGGVVPEGADANSIAAEAVAGLFNGQGRLREGYQPEELAQDTKHNLVAGYRKRWHR